MLDRTLACLLGSALALAVGVGLADPARADDADPPVEVVQETGVVRSVSDGDTVNVDVDGDGTLRHKRVRLAGIQATEEEHAGDPGSDDRCHSQEARQALVRLVLGKRVQLRSLSGTSMAYDGVRMLRTVWVEQDGVWVDAGRRLLEDGHAFWYASEEWTHNAEYQRVSLAAQAVPRNLWDTSHCGAGPAAGADLALSLVWNAPGNDVTNPNGEQVTITNRGGRDVDLSGWKVRDQTIHHEFTFPAGASVAAGRSVVLHIGQGTASSDRFYWGNAGPLFGNDTSQGHGEGVYLLDPDDDFRAWTEYPCVVACPDVNAGSLRIAAVQHDAPGNDVLNPNGEWVRITNTSSDRTIDLLGYRVQHAPYSYAFRAGRSLAPGESFVLYTGRGTGTRTTGYWAFDGGIYWNGGERVELVNAEQVRLDCRAWGVASC